MLKKYFVKFLCALLLLSLASNSYAQAKKMRGLKDEVKSRFLMGVALTDAQVVNRFPEKTEIIKRHFNSIVAENTMKSGFLQPREGEFNFEAADAFVEFGLKNKMFIIGHTLIWHSQLPDWFCVDSDGKNVSADVLKKRMKAHIQTVVGRYKGKVKGWDVVNEAIEGDGSFRKSKFYEILGEEFIELAFKYAHEADPNAELYYNDYGMDGEKKRDGVVALVKNLKKKRIRIDGVGMQGHMGLVHPDIAEFEKSINAFSSAGVKVMITEWDMSALPSAWGASANISDTQEFNAKYNPYTESLPEDVSEKWNARMEEFFRLFLRHSNSISRVAFWGVSDDDSWLNNFPMRGRTDYALAFSRDLKPKPFVEKILKGKVRERALPKTK